MKKFYKAPSLRGAERSEHDVAIQCKQQRKNGLRLRSRYALLIAMTLSLIFHINPTFAAELTAAKLQEYCAETEKGFTGKTFDASKAEICKGYMMGFFDSIIISEQLLGKPQFCIPPALPKTQNNTILNNWVNDNKSIAETTTAAVALFSAYNKAFPCK